LSGKDVLFVGHRIDDAKTGTYKILGAIVIGFTGPRALTGLTAQAGQFRLTRSLLGLATAVDRIGDTRLFGTATIGADREQCFISPRVDLRHTDDIVRTLQRTADAHHQNKRKAR